MNELLPQIPNLAHEVWGLVRQIPLGEFSTYGHVARALGDVSASRFVGDIMLHHDHLPSCCCHRLVRKDGSLGKFVTSEVSQKASQLQAEGISVEFIVPKGRNVTDQEAGVYKIPHQDPWTDFQSSEPLQGLAEYQTQVASLADVARPLPEHTDVIGGVDVSFVPKSNLAVAAYVEVSLSSKSCVYVKTYTAELLFPYVSGYLAFRELPLLLELLRQVRAERDLANVIVVDGSGVLHPRRAGVATMLGVAANVATIGITKKHLIGSVDIAGLKGDAFREIFVNEVICGFAMLPGSGSRKPIYVSPGHRCDAASALAIAQQCRRGRRLPEPIYWADHLSREAAKSAS